nr:MAG TPA: hypothetical protein [Caudoviricetes sp.]
MRPVFLAKCLTLRKQQKGERGIFPPQESTTYENITVERI